MLNRKKERTRTIPIRFDEEMQRRITRAAKRLGSNNSAIVRFAVMNQLGDIERGTIRINPTTKK